MAEKKKTREPIRWKRLAEEGKLEEALLDFVATRTHKATIFPDIQNYFKKYMNTRGDITIQADKFVIIWQGLSQELADMITKLVNEEKLFYHPCNPIYYIKGETQEYLYLPPLTPDVKQLKEPHWLITLISTEKMPDLKKKARDLESEAVIREKESSIIQPGQKPKEQRKKLILPT